MTVLGRINGIKTEDYTKSSFSDVNIKSWYGGYLQWAYENKIISGVGGDKFAPNQSVTREQMASILNNYENWKSKKDKGASGTPLSYTDAGQISGWAEDGVRLCTEKKWLSGYPDSSFRPSKTATRAEVAQIISNLCQ